MTEQEIDNHFKGYKLHHFLMYFPLGYLFGNGLVKNEPIEWICALIAMIGGLLQGRFWFIGMKKFIQFIKSEFLNN